MTLLKCKMCGGDIKADANQAYGTCDSCGSTMTLPKVSDERIANLHNRATHYRQQNEFDKALATYENILTENANDAEAHWGVVLSKYGIEYVEDPKSHERIPTCHRVQSDPILSDLDYKAALENTTDGYTQSLYEQEAKKIAEIQKGILAVSSKAEPYDVFICYKETDATGKRTVDSTIAQDIYYQLDKEGLRVFFASITLEDRLGKEYEPYIFAALNSAKVMLVVGTKQEYINAVWVKNEWSRFASLAKKDREKVIIPCYRDMDAYDLPDELSMFQSQDMSKIGFIQDLVHGIKKIVAVKEQVPATVIHATPDLSAQTESLLKRAFIVLEDAEWKKADDLLEQVLNSDPEKAKAYVGKLMSELKINKEENLAKRAVNLSDYSNFQKAVRFAEEPYKSVLLDYKKTAIYNIAKNEMDAQFKVMDRAKNIFLFSLVIIILTAIIGALMTVGGDNTLGSVLLAPSICCAPIFLIPFGISWRINTTMYKRKEQIANKMRKELDESGIKID